MKRSGSKSGLFIVELIIALLLFAFCAAICLQLFVFADQRTKDSVALSKSVFLATTISEIYKASGDLEKVARVMDFPAAAFAKTGPGGETLTVHYDSDFKLASEDNRVYTLSVNYDPPGGGTANISVSYTGSRGDWVVFSLTVAGVTSNA
jgi:hypothetical protein